MQNFHVMRSTILKAFTSKYKHQRWTKLSRVRKEASCCLSMKHMEAAFRRALVCCLLYHLGLLLWQQDVASELSWQVWSLRSAVPLLLVLSQGVEKMPTISYFVIELIDLYGFSCLLHSAPWGLLNEIAHITMGGPTLTRLDRKLVAKSPQP